MIHELKPYPAMKNSGLPWLGEIPKHWEVRRGKFVFNCIDVRSKAGEEELLTVSSKDGVVPRREKAVTMFMAESYEGYKLCWLGDLVINSLWAWAGGLGFSHHHGIVSSAYGVYRPLEEFSYHWKYFDYILRSKVYDWEFHVRSKGIWVSRLQLTDESFLDMPIVLPPISEAVAIAQFLTVASSLIIRFIRDKRRLIELLNEQKHAIIHQAVTRGLDPNVRLKPSGIEWLGNVPMHWEISKLKYLVPSVTVGIVVTPSRFYVDKGVPCLRSMNISSGHIIPKDMVYISNQSNEFHSKSKIFTDDVVLVRTGKTGVAAIVTSEFEGANCIDLVIVRRSPKIIPEFLHYYINAPATQRQVEEFSVGSIQAHYNVSTVGNLFLALPPVSEQQQIIDYLNTQTKEVNAVISKSEREIDLLREYRTRLISDVVTGKLDVRGVELPAMDDAEVLDDIEIGEDIETEELIESEEVADAHN